jgi:predicted dehydrogenase
MNRRRFAQLSAMTLAATQLPLRAQAAGKPVGYAIIGLGSIGEIFARACANSQTAKITALVTGEPDTKGKEWAARYGVPANAVLGYADLEKLKNNPDVDAVYVALPNSMHREYTVRSAKIGKHVLCEKPMAISSAECREMIDACKQANVKLMIAYRVHYDPTWIQVKQMVKSGSLGDVQSFAGGFFAQMRAGQWRLDRKLGGGGSLMDLGIYPLNAIRWITDEEPAAYTAVTATRTNDGRFTQVEQSIEWTMKMPSGILAACGSSYGQSGPSSLTINGLRGMLQIDSAYSYQGIRVSGMANRERVNLVSEGVSPFQFQIEAEDFAHCIRTGTESRTPGEEGLKDLLAMEAIYKAAGAPIA